MTREPQRASMRTFFDALFATQVGRVHFAVGSDPRLTDSGKYEFGDWSQHHRAWPDEADLIEREIGREVHQSDVYVCPYLMHADKRTPGGAVARSVLHADVDGGALDLDKVRQLGGFAIGSGSDGNGHVYVPLAESVPAHWHKALERGLVAHLGADPAKVNTNDLLRPPGTLNYKPTVFAPGSDPAPVEFLIEPDGTRMDPQTVAELLGVTFPAAAGPTITAGVVASSEAESVDLEQFPRVAQALRQESSPPDRSVDTARVVGACYDAGLTLAQTRFAVSTRQDLAARVAERADDDVATCWHKIDTDRRTKSQQQQQADGRARPVRGRAATSPAETPRVWRAADLKPAQQPRWLAKSRVMSAAINLLIGDEGIGKSLLWVWIAAAVTTGKALPAFGIPAREPGDILLAITEDDWCTTVLPRLEVAGADIGRVHVICIDADGSGAPEFPADIDLIRNADPRPEMVVVDAWLDTVPPGMSVRDPQQARQALHPWKEVANTTGAAVLLITHTNRVPSANPRDRYGATGELRKKARLTLFAQQDEDGHLLVGPEKANSAAPVAASIFGIEGIRHFEAADDQDGTVPRMKHLGDSTRTAREHLAAAHEDAHGDDDQQDRIDAEKWLERYLAIEGPQARSKVAKDEAKKAGISERTLQRARRKLGVVIGYEGQPPVSTWTLPDQTGDD
jgi:hypothetical protein